MNNYNARKQNRNETNTFYLALSEKCQILKPAQTSAKQSRARYNSKPSKGRLIKKDEKERNDRDIRNILLVPQSWQAELIEEVQENFNLKVMPDADKLAQTVSQTVQSEKPKFICISIEQGSENSCTTTKTQSMQCLIQSLARLFQKATICIYSISKQTKGRNQFYDMLSIRREVKTDTRLLVQTNICNNSKSGVILRKLIDVAKEREKLMTEQTPVQAVVIKLKGIMLVPKHPQLEQNSDVEIEVSAGGFGEIGSKDLMGADKLRAYYHVIKVSEQQQYGEVENSLNRLRKEKKVVKESQLIQKIRVLQIELIQKKKELEEQRKRVADQEAIQAQLEDIVLPSERPMVNIDKYESRINVGSRKSSFRNKNQ